MTVRRTTGSLAGNSTTQFGSSYPPGQTLNAIDNLTNETGTFSGWTAGASAQDQVDLLGPLPYTATILGYAINAQLGLHTNGTDPAWGKFEKIIAAIKFGATQADPFFGSAPLPTDSSLISTVWDPAADSLPPSDLASLMPIGVEFQLPQSLPILEQSLAIGVWLTPSLLSLEHSGLVTNVGLAIYNAQYSVVYDDGR